MIPLIQIAREAREKGRANARAEAQQEAERSEREARRHEKLERCLAGFDYEISFADDGSADVALKHPTNPGEWLAFTVSSFGSEDEPLFPDDAWEIRIYAGRVTRWDVPLALAANEYAIEEEQ